MAGWTITGHATIVCGAKAYIVFTRLGICTLKLCKFSIQKKEGHPPVLLCLDAGPKPAAYSVAVQGGRPLQDVHFSWFLTRENGRGKHEKGAYRVCSALRGLE
jgi:hypothetical protein